MGKAGYSTYMIERLSGFGGHIDRKPAADLAEVPDLARRLSAIMGSQEFVRASCIGPVKLVSLERVVDIVLAARPATILFEGANPRHEHEWTVWRDAAIPDDKTLAPGVIDTCSNYVEYPELIAQRLERFVGIVGADRVIGSTDCGFGTFAGYGKIDPLVTAKKLKALREGADLASSRL